MPRPRVVVDDGYRSYNTEREVLAPLDADVALVPCAGDAARVAAAVADADAVLVRESPVDAAAIAAMQRLSSDQAVEPATGQIAQRSPNGSLGRKSRIQVV